MAVLAFVLLFVLLGLGALFLAFSGGRGRSRTPVSRSSRRGITVLFLLSIVVLGIAVPAFVIASDRNRDSIPEAGVAHLTALQLEGRELFGQRCRNCHTLKAANATANIGPSLDTPRDEAVVLDAIEKGRAGGNGNMPVQVFEGEQAKAVAQFVAVASGGKLESEKQADEQAAQDEAAGE